MKALRNFIIGISVCLAVLLFLNMTFLGTAIAFFREGRMAYGLTVGSLPVGGMTREEAAREIRRAAETALAGDALVLSLPSDGRSFVFRAPEIGLSADLDKTLDDAYHVGRDGSLPEQIFAVLRCALQGREIAPCTTLDDTRFSAALAGVKKEIDREPKDSYISFTPTGVAHHPGTSGQRLDADALAEKVKPQLLALHLPCREGLEPEELPAEIEPEDIRSIDGMLSTCTTYYQPYTGRGDNIEIATAALNDCLVRPGEEMSFNARVGSRVASKGYADAPVIINGKVEQDIGGGVCQVSSTLYNAVLLAGLTPTTRTSHFYPSAYIDAGLDATVADGQIDFAFRNTLQHSILLHTGAVEGALTVSIYGCRSDLPGEYDMETVIIGPPPTVEVYRALYQGDTLISREYLYTDEYDVPPPPEDEKKPATEEKPAAQEPSPTAPAPAQPESPKPETKPEAKPSPKPTEPEQPQPQKPSEKKSDAKTKKPSP